MKITCVVDNCVARGGLWGEHGLSLLIEIQERRVLFDSGDSGDVLLHNLEALKIHPDSINAVVLSHGHHDHAGGLSALASRVLQPPLWAHPHAFRPRFNRGGKRSIGMGPEQRQELAQPFALRLVDVAAEVAPGVWITGEISQRPHPEGRGADHVIREGDGFRPDPYSDDLSLVLRVPAGLVVVCGCAHAGLLNILDQVTSEHEGPLLAVIGGTHLGGARGDQLRQVADHVRRLGSPRLYLNHCTGLDSLLELGRLLPESVHGFGAGSQVEFAEEALV